MQSCSCLERGEMCVKNYSTTCWLHRRKLHQHGEHPYSFHSHEYDKFVWCSSWQNFLVLLRTASKCFSALKPVFPQSGTHTTLFSDIAMELDTRVLAASHGRPSAEAVTNTPLSPSVCTILITFWWIFLMQIAFRWYIEALEDWKCSFLKCPKSVKLPFSHCI